MELDYKEIGRNIRKYRLAKNWKQKELAEKVGITEQHVSHIENAHTQLSLATFVLVANALEVDCNTLLGRTLEGAEKAALHGELVEILDSIGENPEKMRLCVQVCRLVKDYQI